MGVEQVRQIRSFNRVVTQTVGALEESYLDRGRPLGEARLLFEIGRGGADARSLRERLGLDSGYLSRLLRSLRSQGLVEVRGALEDRRVRRAALTEKGLAELAAYDRMSDRLADSILARLDAGQRSRLAAAMGEVERLLNAASVVFALEPPTSIDGRACLELYYRELAARFEGGFDPGAEGAAPPEDMAPPQGFFVIARLRGEPVGCGGLRRIDATTGEIKRVWIAPEARGLKLGTRLIAKLEAQARAIGLARLRLDTNRALTEARALYCKQGYHEVARFNMNRYAHHWFEKRL